MSKSKERALVIVEGQEADEFIGKLLYSRVGFRARCQHLIADNAVGIWEKRLGIGENYDRDY